MTRRIGIEAQRIFREKKHGMDFVALEMIRNLQKIDTVNDYVVFVKSDVDKCLQPTDNFKIVEVPGSTYPFWEQVMLPGAAKSEKVDLLHCTSNTAPVQTRIPVILTLHDVIYMEKSPFEGGSLYQKFGNMYRRLVVPKVIKQARSIITVSEYEKNVIALQFPDIKDKIEVVYNGKSSYFHNKYSEKDIETIQHKYNLPDKFIFFLGNTDPKKNLDRVVKAYAEYCIQEKNPLKMVIADFSDVKLEAILSNHGYNNLKNQFVLPGYIANKDLPLIYNKASLFLYPSLRESFGIPIIEAMACGVPVITSDAASMPEVSGNAAHLVNPKNVDELTEAIRIVTTDKKVKDDLINKGLNRAHDFEWINTSRMVHKLYERIILN